MYTRLTSALKFNALLIVLKHEREKIVMTMRKVLLKKIDASNEQIEIDDSLTCVVEMYYLSATLIALLDTETKVSDVKADKTFAFDRTSNNAHRLFKQVRAFQRRTINLYYHYRSDLTHYVLNKNIKVKVERFNRSERVNRIKIFHLYALENHELFNDLKERISAL